MMKRHRTYTFVFLILTAFMLTACGFHMRGSSDHDRLPFKTILVVIPDASTFGVELKRNLRASGDTVVVSDPKEAQVIMDVMLEKKTKAILSLNVQGRAREYSLIYDLRFRVRNNKGKELLAPTVISLKRTLIFSESHALARESEEDMLYRDMQTDLVQQVMRRLAAIKIPA
jgi:LPS-assembly lipoprotein